MKYRGITGKYTLRFCNTTLWFAFNFDMLGSIRIGAFHLVCKYYVNKNM